MAKFIVKFDLDFFNDAAEIEAEIADSALTIDSELTFPGTYILDGPDDGMNGLAGVLLHERMDVVVPVNMQEYSTAHLDMLNHNYEPGVTFTPQYSGAGQEVYLVDTGVNTGHAEFANATVNNFYSNFDGDFDDVAGHGTAVGSLIVGQNVGSAPNATLHNVKLFNAPEGEITVGEIILCFDAILANHNATVDKVKVICLPWTMPKNDFVDSKIAEMNQGNMVVVAAAGNDGVDVNTLTPAGVDHAITVGAMDANYTVAPFTNAPFSSTGTFNSNFGAQLDIFAMGVDVTYANLQGSYDTGSGTSFASGVVAGVAAQYAEKFSGNIPAGSLKDNMLSEGHIRGVGSLIFDETSGVDYSGIYKSVATVDIQGFVPFAGLQSGRIANMQLNETRDVDMQLHADAANVAALEFAPLPDWITYADGVLSIDASIDPSLSPGVYIFAMKGEVGEDMTVEEYSVGVYTDDVSELEEASSFYYDPDTEAYDEVVNYQVAPTGSKN